MPPWLVPIGKPPFSAWMGGVLKWGPIPFKMLEKEPLANPPNTQEPPFMEAPTYMSPQATGSLIHAALETATDDIASYGGAHSQTNVLHTVDW